MSKLGEGTFSQNKPKITAGGVDYFARSKKEEEVRQKYIKGLQVPPGPPTQHGIYTTPEWTGQPYPSIDWQSISQNQEPPAGWPKYPRFNEPGDVPGPPVQFGEAITNANARAGFNFIPNGVEEKNIYYYHPDHLGSSSYITDRNGEVIQHTEYIAFGETFVDEHSVNPTQPYLFNGKELDYETGLYYYGARYYDAKTSIFLNVDPLVEKTMSPYAYTYNNPINLIDPTGMEAESTQEPPIKGIDYFRDKTGIYFWNTSKDSYEHYTVDKDGKSRFSGYYKPDSKKGPVGNYEIIHNGKDNELAIKDIVKETNYTDVSVEDISLKITLEYSKRDVQETNIFIREKGSKDERKLLNTEKPKRSIFHHMAGVSSEINEYSETRKYGQPNLNKKRKTSSNSGIEIIKNITDIVIDIIKNKKK